MNIATIKSLLEDKLQIRITKKREKVFSYSDYLYASSLRSDPIFLNIGSADFKKNGWITLDYMTEQYKSRQGKSVDINHDLTKNRPISLEDNSLDGAYSSQVIEHLPYESVELLVEEMRRAIRPNGFFRISCPNAYLYCDALKSNDRLFFSKMIEYYDEASRWKKNFTANPKLETIEQLFLNAIASSKSRLTTKEHMCDSDVRNILYAAKSNAIFLDDICNGVEYDRSNPHFHMTWWDPIKLSDLFTKKGFSEVSISLHSQSRVPVYRYLELNDYRYFHHNLYVEARV